MEKDAIHTKTGAAEEEGLAGRAEGQATGSVKAEAELWESKRRLSGRRGHRPFDSLQVIGRTWRGMGACTEFEPQHDLASTG